jgi:hypothetical protein
MHKETRDYKVCKGRLFRRKRRGNLNLSLIGLKQRVFPRNGRDGRNYPETPMPWGGKEGVGRRKLPLKKANN